MWLTACYHQVSLFSLKPSDATSTGGRSLLIPTPFSIKMALLDVALRQHGAATGAASFEHIRDLVIAASPPPQMVVNNCFMRIHKPRRAKGGQSETAEDSNAEEGSDGPFIRSVAFREYVQYYGPLGLAFELSASEDANWLSPLLVQINYFGKRGSLFQIDSSPLVVEQLPTRQGYIRLDGQEAELQSSNAHAILQVLDDCGPTLTFSKTNIYSGEAIKLGTDRVQRSVVLPYQLTRSSRGFSLYERLPAG